MTKHAVGLLRDFPEGSQRRVEVAGRPIAVFNVRGSLHALVDTCPHRGGSLSQGTVVGRIDSTYPGCYDYDAGQTLVKCPWHGWEFDLRTGQGWVDPEKLRVRPYPISVQQAPAEAVPGPYVAELVPISVEAQDIVVVDLDRNPPGGEGR